MKRIVVAMFGVLIVMLCIMPVLAREDSGTAPMAGGGQSVGQRNSTNGWWGAIG